jgi:hypothetical protein
MRAFEFSRCALSVSVAAALLSACGGASIPKGTDNAAGDVGAAKNSKTFHYTGGRGGAGGTQTVGGAAGAGGKGHKSSENGQPGGDGALGLGGNGGKGGAGGSSSQPGPAGAGGGGGYYGGGGGGGSATAPYTSLDFGSGGGGGGSSYVEPSVIRSRMWTGWEATGKGDGQVIFSWR